MPLANIFAFRSLYATFDKETEVSGINVYRYISTEDSFARTPENECFCPSRFNEKEEEYLDCPPSGIVDLTACLKAPILLSYPHFYMADPKLLDFVSGLNPQKELHESYAFLEPV